MDYPPPVQAIYDRAKADIDAMDADGEHAMLFGPGHIVWADQNMEDGFIDYCLEACDSNVAHWCEWLSPQAIERVRQSLIELKAVPERAPDNSPPSPTAETPP